MHLKKTIRNGNGLLIKNSGLEIFEKSDLTWNFSQMDLRQMGYDCNSAKEMLEALVNDEYCTYIVGKFENYEAILRALRSVFKIE